MCLFLSDFGATLHYAILCNQSINQCSKAKGVVAQLLPKKPHPYALPATSLKMQAKDMGHTYVEIDFKSSEVALII